jgi:hypothetical protein
MSYEELDRVRVIERVVERRLTQAEAAGLTSRQVRRLRRGYERDGARALASKHRGRPSNRRLPAALRREALATVRSRYEGFRPTLAHEKLTELHGSRTACGSPGLAASRGSSSPGGAGRVGASSSRSMAATTSGSRSARLAAPCWCSSTTPPAP